MSQYPYGYGQYPTHPPPFPPPTQYAFPNPAAYPPAPAYGSPQDPNAPAPNYYAMTQSAYDYNSSIPGIPGLGIGGTPIAGAAYPPPPALPAWGHQPPIHQDLNSQFTAGTRGDALSQYHYSAPAQFDGPADQNYPPPSYNPHPLPPKPVSHPHLSDAATQSSDEMEEGELSEGQFEDLYEPMDSSAKSKDTTVAPNVPSIPNESQPTSAVDTPSGGFYTNEDDSDSRNQPLDSTGAKVDGHVHNLDERQEPTAARERSGSYSPYLSPREIQDASTPNTSGLSTQGHQKANGQVGPSALNGSGNGQVPGLGQPANSAPDTSNTSNAVAATKSATSQNPTTNGNNSDNQHPYMPGTKALAEAKKEAQKAILRLWPLGVKYQHYIDEGFDEKVIKLLFNELHLDMTTGKPIQPDNARQPQQSLADAGSSVPATSKPPVAERKPSPQTGTKPPQGDKMDKSEERKDRIARLLAAKAAKGPAPTATPKPAPAPAPGSVEVTTQPQVSAPALVPASASNLVATQAQVPARNASPALAPAQGIIHAQVSAPFTATTQALAQAPVQPPAVANPTMTARSSATSTPTGPKPKTKEEIERLLRQKMEALQKSRELGAQKADSEKTTSSPVKSGGAETAMHGTSLQTPAVLGGLSTATATSQQISNQDKGPIPGLFLSSASQAMQPINVRKRPVASDFVDYSSLESRKRPFGQDRQTSSLVIDVSDGSDDEEMDIDMDMDSPTDTPLTIQRSNTSDRKGPSLAEFPPLRDLSRRNVSSPAPPAQTPPAGLMSTQEKELLAKEKAIQEMRRKIAEFEAKKKAKGGSQTPSQAAATPSEGNDSESSGSNGHRASSVSVDKVDGPSAQLISEAVSAKMPKPSDLGLKNNVQAERGRSVSHGASRVDSVLEEKKKKLVALREAREARIREAEARIKAEEARIREEEARMQEEEARLEAEFDGAAEMEHGSDEDNQSEHMSIDEPPEDETPTNNEGRQNGDNPAVPTSTTVGNREQTADAATEAQDVRMNDASQPAIEDASSSQADRLDKSHEAANNYQDPVAVSQQQVEDVPTVEQVTVIEQAPDSSMDNATTELPTTSASGQPAQEAQSDSYKPAEAMATDSADHVDIPDSPEFSPEPAGNAAGHIDAQIGEQSVPATISDVTRSRDDIQEIEVAVASEPKQPVAPKPNSSFVPYESPLRYFRAFKFHPEFNKFVPGGQKSLTYSNKIDPRKELCPSELQGGACPRGEACEFQHLSSIGISDEQILVELGRSDDYTGEQKSRFIAGLKELLQNFRANQVRDFDTIANGIIEFRSRFLGDKSKILPLEGVTL
ncbi:hypothetical protein CONLIGDRAFT_293095 [Coniochaeta ligniaria NRRL 30616]|uniref:C3H1-type domain-containing protein n=1 Tax=Coniochaeta ligniaria NRRL 30616 TaxID=1408157 RepID=A0A1J7IU68_9PEZI|nr:hypothetical protein CONLIGDRAFT_293095 [Coniochaeta ligniaria NRRL 30616]